MSVRAQLLLIFCAPLALLGALYALGLSLPVPALGRAYVVRLELPPVGEPVDLPRIYGPPDKSRPLVVIDAGHGGHDPGAGRGSAKRTSSSPSPPRCATTWSGRAEFVWP